MPVISMPGIRPVNFGTLDVSVTRAENGATYIRPARPLAMFLSPPSPFSTTGPSTCLTGCSSQTACPMANGGA